jgi:N utilization substance protein B
MLYSMEVQKDVSVSHARTVLDMFSKAFPQSIEDFSLHLVHGVLAHKKEIDSLVREQSYHWKFDRIALIDRQVMRIALFELLYDSKTPAPVCINEAVDIAKMFSTCESGHFINGILDNIRKNSESVDS